MIGLVENLLLAVVKIIVGKSINAQMIVLDGLNSLSDALSSVLSIFSASLGKKQANKRHPLGYGRVEYLFSLLITMLIFYISLTAVIDAVKAIITPEEPPEYTLAAVVIMLVSFAVKVVYGIVMRRKGKELRSESMQVTAADSLCDGLVAAAVLLAILIYKLTGTDIQNFLCIGISLMIAYSCVQAFFSCINKLIGTAPDPEVKKMINNIILGEEEVKYVANLVLHNYGENIYVGSLDVVVDGSMPAAKISCLSRKLIRLAGENGVRLTSVGVISTATGDQRALEVCDLAIETARKYPDVRGVRPFNISFEEKMFSIGVIMDYSVKDKEKVLKSFEKELREYYPDIDIELYEMLDL